MMELSTPLWRRIDELRKWFEIILMEPFQIAELKIKSFEDINKSNLKESCEIMFKTYKKLKNTENNIMETLLNDADLIKRIVMEIYQTFGQVLDADILNFLKKYKHYAFV